MQCDIKFQDQEKSARNIRGFGSDSYCKIKEIYTSKQHLFTLNFATALDLRLVCNSQSKVRNVTFYKVLFKYDMSVQTKISSAKNSRPEGV